MNNYCNTTKKLDQMFADCALFTIVAANYISYAATLMQSVRAQHPELARFIVLIGDLPTLTDVDLAAEVIAIDRCGIAQLANMALWYDVLELSTAVKPSAFLHLFAIGFRKVVYLDPDILVTAPLYPVWDALREHSCVLTPHHTKSLRDGARPDDLTILRAGVYNLGFIGLRADEDGETLARWWADQLLTGCRVDLDRGMFTDQRWMDLAPALVSRAMILRHPGCNLAYWNLPHRNLAGDLERGITVDDHPLVFAHFSGIQPDNPKVFSRHQDRYTADNLPVLMAELSRRYRELLHANRWAVTNGLTYPYERFADGRRIERLMRRWLLRAIDEGHLDPQQDVRIASNFFDGLAEAPDLGAPVTRLMHQLWLERRDLQANFALNSRAGVEAYRGWFFDGGAHESGIDPRSIDAAQNIWRPSPACPPWSPVACAAWLGQAAEVGDYLGETVRFPLAARDGVLTRGLALLWEQRPDLRHHFPMRTEAELTAYLGWCLTDGLAEGSVIPEMFSDDILRMLVEPVQDPAAPDTLGWDMPITRAFVATACYGGAQTWLSSATAALTETRKHLTHAFWFAFLAPRRLGWPEALVASARAWMHERSDLSFTGYTLCRGEVVLWWLRSDVSAVHAFMDVKGRRDFLLWLLVFGLNELGLEVAEFNPTLAQRLVDEPIGFEGIPWFGLLVHDARPDLRRIFDLSDPTARREFNGWCKAHLLEEHVHTAVGRTLAPSAAKVSEPTRVTLVITGFWSGQSGIGEHLRATAASLRHCGFTDFVILDRFDGRILLPDGTPLAAGTTVMAKCNLVHLNADTAYGDWLWLRKRGVRASRTIGYWAWELEALPSYWLSSFSFYDEIWGISAFTTAALRRAGLRHVRTVAQPIELPQSFRHLPRESFGWKNGETVFITMFDPQSYVARKNPDGVVKAFAQAFPFGDEEVRLVVKSHGGENFPHAMHALKSLTADPRVQFLDEYTDRDRLLGLIAAADAFVSLHRAEGFGRGPAEAMLLKKPAIVTDYSGTQDFAGRETALLVPYRLVPIPPDHYTGVEEQRWAEPDLSVAAAHMGWIAGHRPEALELGVRAREHIMARYDYSTVGKQMLLNLDLGTHRSESRN